MGWDEAEGNGRFGKRVSRTENSSHLNCTKWYALQSKRQSCWTLPTPSLMKEVKHMSFSQYYQECTRYSGSYYLVCQGHMARKQSLGLQPRLLASQVHSPTNQYFRDKCLILSFAHTSLCFCLEMVPMMPEGGAPLCSSLPPLPASILLSFVLNSFLLGRGSFFLLFLPVSNSN